MIRTGTYAITGSTGLMGTTALMRLRNVPGVKVRAVYHRRQPFIDGDNIHYIKADVTDEAACRDIVAGCDYVLSFAGILMTAPVLAANAVTPLTDNLRMVARLLEASHHAGVRKFVHISSSTGYPDQDNLLREEDMFRGEPAEAYFGVGWLYRYLEKLCRLYATKLNPPLPIAVLRPSTVYGPYENFDPAASHMLPALIRKVVERCDPIEIWGSGAVRRDLVHAADLFNACLLVLARAEVYDVFNIAHGMEYSIDELLAMALEMDGYRNAPVVYNDNRPKAGGRRVLATDMAREILGFVPKISMKEGIREMITWYRNHWTAAQEERQ